MMNEPDASGPSPRPSPQGEGEKQSEPGQPDPRDLSIKFTIIFGLFAFIPLVLMYHFLSIRKSPEPAENNASAGPSAPAIIFKNVTAESGISFTRESGA